MTYDKPITIQVMDTETEQWTDHLHLHARVNRVGAGESFGAGAEQYRLRLTFDLRHCAALEPLRYSPQVYRIVYRGHTYNIQDYDDYMEQHRTVRLAGELYG